MHVLITHGHQVPHQIFVAILSCFNTQSLHLWCLGMRSNVGVGPGLVGCSEKARKSSFWAICYTA